MWNMKHVVLWNVIPDCVISDSYLPCSYTKNAKTQSQMTICDCEKNTYIFLSYYSCYLWIYIFVDLICFIFCFVASYFFYLSK
jgi:hypothetical protein